MQISITIWCLPSFYLHSQLVIVRPKKINKIGSSFDHKSAKLLVGNYSRIVPYKWQTEVLLFCTYLLCKISFTKVLQFWNLCNTLQLPINTKCCTLENHKKLSYLESKKIKNIRQLDSPATWFCEAEIHHRKILYSREY